MTCGKRLGKEEEPEEAPYEQHIPTKGGKEVAGVRHSQHR